MANWAVARLRDHIRNLYGQYERTYIEYRVHLAQTLDAKEASVHNQQLIKSLRAQIVKAKDTNPQMIAAAAPTRAPTQPPASALPYLCKAGSTSVLAANNPRRLRYNEDDDSDAEDAVAGPALAAEDMGLNLDEELEQAIFGTSGEESSARVPGRRKPDNRTKRAIPPPTAPQPSAVHEYALRIKELEHVNSQLRATLLLSSQEVKALRQEALEQSMGLGGGAADNGGEIGETGAREAKIILLAKKACARRLTVALERERTQNTVLSNKLKQMQLDAKPAAVPVPARDTRDETKALRDKLAQVTRKLEEERTVAQALRTDVRNMHLALKKEVGDEMPLSQAKIQTLMANRNSTAANGAASPGPGSSSYDSAHRAAIRRIESERKVAMEASAGELEETRRSLEDAKRKCDAAGARNR
ncbi:Coiled-coil domain-containing protein 13 [Geranomyces variabilis]|uniref:Coiled-coil domain-containing protein 13 n=1 Tax=Geranomyces variabilis TaxID=109894 RepID=A0AAD5XM72_9FUNG|nr:Coiled-coil domain-containing protein 13 [Geranomyces variabilis]